MTNTQQATPSREPYSLPITTQELSGYKEGGKVWYPLSQLGGLLCQKQDYCVSRIKEYEGQHPGGFLPQEFRFNVDELPYEATKAGMMFVLACVFQSVKSRMLYRTLAHSND